MHQLVVYADSLSIHSYFSIYSDMIITLSPGV